MEELKRRASTSPAKADDVYEYVMSDATVDSYGDVIDPEGWMLSIFKKNPIALFNHDKDFPIGTWEKVRVEGGKLIGRINFMAAVSDRLREIQEAVKAGVLRAVSVGFRPIDYEPIKGTNGYRYIKSELVECSLVSVPANPNALQLARSLNLSREAQEIIFGKIAADLDRPRAPGVIAKTPKTNPSKGARAMTLSERIEAAKAELNKVTDQFTEHMAKASEGAMDEGDITITGELTEKIKSSKRTIEALEKAESVLAEKAAAPAKTGLEKPAYGQTKVKSVEGKELVMRGLVARFLAHVENRQYSDVLVERYGDNEETRIVAGVVNRASSTVATTGTVGWAAELVNTAFAQFIDSLIPASVYPKLAALGNRFTFGQNGKITIPARNTALQVAGGFVGEGSPIPVKQAGFTSVSLVPKSVKVITSFSREIAIHSTPTIESVLRDAIQEDTSIAIDQVLLGTGAATAISPAGLRNGLTTLTPTAGGGFAAAVGDLKGLVGALITGSNGQLRQPVFIMNPLQVLSLSLTQNAGGDFPFAADLAQGRLQGYPLIQSTTVPSGTVLIADAADFVSVTGDVPQFMVSDQATLHMEDTTPLAIGTSGAPNVVAAPVRSMFQTDSIALRMVLDMNWAMRRTGVVAFVAGVTW